MPYQVTLTRKGGKVAGDFRIYHRRTPQRGDEIEVVLDDGTVAMAVVTLISTMPSKSPGTAVQAVDHVAAKEK